MNRPLWRLAPSLTIILCVGLLCASAARGAPDAPSAPSAPSLKAEEIFTNGQIYTPTGWAQAIAIKRGVMIAFGSDQDVNEYTGPDTRITREALGSQADSGMPPRSAGASSSART